MYFTCGYCMPGVIARGSYVYVARILLVSENGGAANGVF